MFTDLTSGATYEADIVAKVRFQEQPAYFLIHLEHQAQPEEAFNLRMFRYFALFHFKKGLPVYPIALFSDDSSRRTEPDTYRVVVSDLEVLQFRYRVIQLRHLNWRDFAARRNPIASALLPKMGMQHSERPQVLLTSLRLLAQLGLDAARGRLISGFINTYLHLNKQEQAQFETELAQLSPNEQEATMELTTTWKDEGRQEGRLEGQRREARNLTLRLLRRRFGPVAADLEAQIGMLALVQVETLFEELLDFASIEDLHVWLAANPPDTPNQGSQTE